MCESGISVWVFHKRYNTHIFGGDFLFLQGSNHKTGISFNLGSIHGWNVQELLAGGDWSRPAA
jgi:hypothetical protein